ncbi:MAG: pyridoxamine 5'-phosphate oxidase family protein [Solirubrobacterales bacterium]
MAKVFERIDDHMRGWIARQPMFFVATAPLAGDGHVNVSPKGPIGTLKVFDDHTVAYLDMVGSGGETIAHLRENGRIVVMFCAFEGPPRIVRLHGRGEVVAAADGRFEELFERGGFELPSLAEARRSIIVVAVDRVSDSCGYGVPLMSHEGEREHARLAAEKRLRVMGAEGLREHVASRNEASIDGLPVLDRDRVG